MKDSNSQSPSSRWLADIALLATVFMWGLNLPIMKYALQQMDKFAFNAVRLTVSTITLGAIVWWLRAPVIDRQPDAAPVNRQWLKVLLFAILTGFGYQTLFLVGIDSTSAGNTGLILSAIPMWIAILAFIFLKERLSAASWAGLTIAIMGVLIVTLSKPATADSTNSLTGNVLVSIAAFSWAAASVWSMPMMRNISPVALTFYSIAFSLPLHFVMSGGNLELSKLANQPLLLLSLLYSGVFSTGIASALWNYGLKNLGPSHAAGFQNLVPIIAIFSSWMILGEVPFALQIGGGLLIIAGLVIMRAWKNKKPVASPLAPDPKQA